MEIESLCYSNSVKAWLHPEMTYLMVDFLWHNIVLNYRFYEKPFLPTAWHQIKLLIVWCPINQTLDSALTACTITFIYFAKETDAQKKRKIDSAQKTETTRSIFIKMKCYGLSLCTQPQKRRCCRHSCAPNGFLRHTSSIIINVNIIWS